MLGWSSFNKPVSIAQGTATLAFVHGPEHQRVKQTAPEGVTLYLSDLGVTVEKVTGSGGTAQWNEYLVAGGITVGERFVHADNSVTTRYFHQDHLGSVAGFR